VLIGLHPSLTQIVLPDHSPGYQGVGAPKAVVQSAEGGAAIVAGIGIATGGINPRATGLLWTAGAASLVDDVKFQGGHGTDLPDGTRFDPYNANHSGDPDPNKRWDAQYPSLWVTRGGGGTFSGIWTPNTYAQAGMYVSDTDTPGHVYEMSSEHHVRTEIALNRVAHWEFLAPQTEEEVGEGQDTISLDIRDSHDILVANYHAYRVTRSIKPAASAVRLSNSADIRFRNVHVNAESGIGLCQDDACFTYLRASKFPYENAIEDVTHGIAVREPGRLFLANMRSLIDDVVLVEEGDIEQAIVMLLEIEKTLVEGAGAAGLAALLKYPDRFQGRKVGLVLGGGNIDPLLLAAIIERGMVRAGRLARIRVSARDVPGSLARITAIVSEAGANIDEVHHQRAFTMLAAQNVDIELVVQTRGRDHIQDVIDALHAGGFQAQEQ